MAIQRGDRLILIIKGMNTSVVALLDETEGNVMVRDCQGRASRQQVSRLRPDTSPLPRVFKNEPVGETD